MKEIMNEHGEKPAEVRARELADDPRWKDAGTMPVSDAGAEADAAHRSWVREVRDVLRALSFPKEGATAAGADAEIADIGREVQRWHDRYDAQEGKSSDEDYTADLLWRLSALIIESLQRQVADLTKDRDAQWKIAQNYRLGIAHKQSDWDNLIERAEAAESSLHSMGDALERAREALRRVRGQLVEAEIAARGVSVIADNTPDRNAYQAHADKLKTEIDLIDLALTPPKQEPATHEDV